MPFRAHVTDGISPRCAGEVAARVEVLLDGEAVGSVELPCIQAIVAPRPTHVLPGPEVAAGLHEVTVRASLGDRGAVEASAIVSLPAIDFLEGTSAALGAELPIVVSSDDVQISPPLVYPPKGL